MQKANPRGPANNLGCRSLLITLDNLQKGADLVYHLDTPWTPYLLAQRDGRVRRLKQPSPHVLSIRPVMAHSVEEYKHKQLAKKQEFIETVVFGKPPSSPEKDAEVVTLKEIAAGLGYSID